MLFRLFKIAEKKIHGYVMYNVCARDVSIDFVWWIIKPQNLKYYQWTYLPTTGMTATISRVHAPVASSQANAEGKLLDVGGL